MDITKNRKGETNNDKNNSFNKILINKIKLSKLYI